jgi:multidrug efflux pump subunit AcrA (membrane-fusion protein)
VISEVSSAADPRTGLFPAELRLDPAADLTLASGLVAKVRIEPIAARRSQLTHVPIAAVVEGDGDRANVYVVEGALARKREITVAFIEGEQVALTRGLKPGELVVTEGALYLQNGDRIRIYSER